MERMKSAISRAGDRLFSGLRGVHAMAMRARLGAMDSTDSEGSNNSPRSVQRRRTGRAAGNGTGTTTTVNGGGRLRSSNSDEEDYLVEVPATTQPPNGHNHMTNGDSHHHHTYVPLTIEEELEVERPLQQAQNDLLDQLILAQANVNHLLRQVCRKSSSDFTVLYLMELNIGASIDQLFIAH